MSKMTSRSALPAMRTRLSVRGQVVIPAKAREQLHLKEGMELSVEVKEGALVLRKAKPTSWKKWQGALKDTSALRILEGEHREEIRKGR